MKIIIIHKAAENTRLPQHHHSKLGVRQVRLHAIATLPLRSAMIAKREIKPKLRFMKTLQGDGIAFHWFGDSNGPTSHSLPWH